MTATTAPEWEDISPLKGIDHAAFTTRDEKTNVAFYEGVLGLHLSRSSSTDSDHGPLSYSRGPGERPFLHFMVDEEAEPPNAGAGLVKRIGMPVATYGVYEDSFFYWGDRLDAAGIQFDSNFNEPMIWFDDPEGLGILIMIYIGDKDPEGRIEFRPDSPVPLKYQLTGIQGVYCRVPDRLTSARFMRETFGCALHDQRDVEWANRVFNHCGGALFMWDEAEEMKVSAGGVHHVALRFPADELDALHDRLIAAGMDLEQIAHLPDIDPRCFRVTEPGGLTLEIAASPNE